MMLDRYIKILTHLRTDKNRKKWSSLTSHQAPHKPFLLLSVMDLIAEGQVKSNFIEPSFELVDTFNLYFSRVMPPGSRGNMAYPFPRLRTDGFWNLLPNPGYEDQANTEISSMTKLREVFAGAKIDDGLFELMIRPDMREFLRAAIIRSYFALEIQPLVAEQGKVNLASWDYSRKLLKVAEQSESFEADIQPETIRKVRDQGFRKAVISLYKHRCAMCGIRMLTPEGHTIVKAAHIVPWNESHDDRPGNGMALCRLCHWSFDEGLMTVGKEYEVIVSKRIASEQNLPGHILTLSERNIFTPDENDLWPHQENFEWHRRKTFRS